jgi:hypothetical protein
MHKSNASSFSFQDSEPDDWAIDEFAHAQLGDERRTQRLQLIATAFARQPTASLPQACGSAPAIQGAYRFLENDDILPASILAAHHQATCQRLRSHSIVLAIQDTTTLNYSSHPETSGLGFLGSHSEKHLGMHLHTTFAVTPEGQPLGFLHCGSWARRKARGTACKRHVKPITEKESFKWIESLEACEKWAAQCPETTLVNVADREGDLYELFARAQEAGEQARVRLLVRSRHNRKLADGQGRLLWETVAAESPAGSLKVRVGRKGEQPARLVTLSVRFRQVMLPAPGRKAGGPSVLVWAIEAREEHPPKGVGPIRWQLLTTMPVATLEEACERIGWYAQRWQIEVLHKVLKSGCGLELRQLRTAERLKRAMAVDLVVAWRVMAMNKAARTEPGGSISAWLSEAEWKALWCYIHQRTTPPQRPPSVGKAVRWIAQLGGFMARKSDGQPGPMTLWRGLHRLHDLTKMWKLCQSKNKKS